MARVTEKATPQVAFDLATRTYLAGRRLDMRELAAELGVSRTTLYRWTGDRERLLQDVIWALSETAIAEIWADTSRRRGVNRLVEAIRRYAATISASTALRAFVRQEPHVALRLLASRGRFQDRLVAEVQRLAAEEEARGTFTPRTDPAVLAYGVVRLVEGFLYDDTTLQGDPEIDRAIRVIRLLLE